MEVGVDFGSDPPPPPHPVMPIEIAAANTVNRAVVEKDIQLL
jgi:hypothetical protein